MHASGMPWRHLGNLLRGVLARAVQAKPMLAWNPAPGTAAGEAVAGAEVVDAAAVRAAGARALVPAGGASDALVLPHVLTGSWAATQHAHLHPITVHVLPHSPESVDGACDGDGACAAAGDDADGDPSQQAALSPAPGADAFDGLPAHALRGIATSLGLTLDTPLHEALPPRLRRFTVCRLMPIAEALGVPRARKLLRPELIGSIQSKLREHDDAELRTVPELAAMTLDVAVPGAGPSELAKACWAKLSSLRVDEVRALLHTLSSPEADESGGVWAMFGGPGGRRNWWSGTSKFRMGALQGRAVQALRCMHGGERVD